MAGPPMSHHDAEEQRRRVEDASAGDETVLQNSTHKRSTSLIHLKTVLELRDGLSFVEVYIAKVPIKIANDALNLIRRILDTSEVNLQHLRRFAKEADLPQHIAPSPQLVSSSSSAKCESSLLYLLVGPTSSITLSGLKDSLSSLLQADVTQGLVVHACQVPFLAPTSPEQAREWSRLYWPTVYKKSNPFGPHPSIISRAENEISGDLHVWMSMAYQVARQTKSEGLGEAIGATVVDRARENCTPVALAGDCRWLNHPEGSMGNVMAHAALRAIGMVARKLTAAQQKKHEMQVSLMAGLRHQQDIFLDAPLLPDEQTVFQSSLASTDGYLCHGLEIYLTHEPCVMCSMALIHSRFTKVVFGQRMPRTGGLCGETSPPGLSPGYGLFWRKELNWCFLAWESTAKDPDALATISPTINA